MFQTILVAVDSSDLSHRVVATVQNLPLAASTKIILAHVVSLDSQATVAADRHHQANYGQIEQQLESYRNQLPRPCQWEIATGDPADEIIRLAKVYKTDLIVVGSRGLTGVEKIIAGSVSSLVVENSPCSVLVVKS